MAITQQTTINKIIVHCSDSPHRGDQASDINRWHLEAGYDAIGYHEVITESGERQRGRQWFMQGAHCAKNGGNLNSIGICLIGQGQYTPAQMETLGEIINEYCNKWEIIDIAGHSDYDPSKPNCPGIPIREVYKLNR